MPLLQPASNSHLRNKTTKISPHPALPRPTTSVSAGRAVPGLPVCPGSQLSGTQEAIPGRVTLGNLPAFHQKNLTKNERVPDRTFQFLQNRHFPTILLGSFSPAQSIVPVPRPSACRDAWSSAARRLQPGPRILALPAQKARKTFVRIPPHPVHTSLLF